MYEYVISDSLNRNIKCVHKHV